MKLSEITRGRENNLDAIRFLAAVMVIFCHAFPISLGEGSVDFLGRLTDNQMHLGNLAVCIFFFYGGFLICKSACRIRNGKDYFKARILRIIPCLAVVTFVLAFLVGPVITELSLGEYFGNGETYKYLLNSVMILVHNLPGVFQNNIYDTTVNGPLWTLPIEFLCYIMCFIALKIKFLEEKNAKWMIILFTAGYLGAWKLLASSAVLSSALRPAGLFFAGMVYFIYKDKIVIKPWIAAVSAAILVVSAAFHILGITVFFCFPYLMMYLGFGTKHKLSGFAKRGEVSYGMYLCGWPIQQMICQGFGGQMNPWMNILLSVPLSIGCGMLLHQLVEKPLGRLQETQRRKE